MITEDNLFVTQAHIQMKMEINEDCHKAFYDSGNLWWEIKIGINGKMNGKYSEFTDSGLLVRQLNHVDDVVEGENLIYDYEFSCAE